MSTPLLAHQVEISDGLTLADLKTVDACHLALLTLARDINRIEEQLANVGQGSGHAFDGDWIERAESAVRFKKALRQVVHERVGAIKRAEKAAAALTREHLLLEQIKADWPSEFAASLRLAQAARPELWKEATP